MDSLEFILQLALQKPCAICGARAWCAHREPELLEARLEGLERRLRAIRREAERAARAIERVRRTEAA